MFFTLDPDGLHPFAPSSPPVPAELDLGDALGPAAQDLLGEPTVVLSTRRILSVAADDQDGDETVADLNPVESAAGDDSDPTEASAGTTVLTASGGLTVLGWASHVEADDLVRWLATTSSLRGVAADRLDDLADDVDLLEVHVDIVGSEPPARFAGVPTLVVVAQSFDPDVVATIDVLRAAGSPIETRTVGVLTTETGERILSIDRTDDGGAGSDRRRARRSPPPDAARAAAPAIDLSNVAEAEPATSSDSA